LRNQAFYFASNGIGLFVTENPLENRWFIVAVITAIIIIIMGVTVKIRRFNHCIYPTI